MATSSTSYDYASTNVNTAPSMGIVVLYLAILVYAITVMWRIFVKAGRPGWHALVPFYNAYAQLKIVGRPGWWFLLYFIPLVNFVVAIVVAIDLAKSFGRSTTFGVVGCFLFSIVGMSILAFGHDTYHGPAAGGGAEPRTPVDPNAPVAAV